MLLQEVEKEARNMLGIAALASDGPFMANREIFLKNGYKVAAESGSEQLLADRTISTTRLATILKDARR